MSEWSHLPNAAHIDRVIESSNSYPEVWRAVYDSAWDAARSVVWSAARDAAWDAARHAARDAAWSVAWSVAQHAARDAALAFIAYDDAANYLAMPSDQLKVWAILSENPAAILLFPAVIAYERISELELV
jgi:hypothetical protein